MNVDEVVARQKIAECLYRYCRSVDRLDKALYDTVFETGAPIDMGEFFTGTESEFQTWVWAVHESMQGHSHQITNVTIRVDELAGRAASEAYVTVCLRTQADHDGKTTDVVDRGRYLDQWKRLNNGSWKISERRYVSDIQQHVNSTASPAVTSSRDCTDPSYDLFAPFDET